MRIIRRFVFTAAFLVASVLMIRAAKQYGDFLFMFYPGVMREVQAFLSEFSAKFDYLLWERAALIALCWAGITLLLDILLQENLLRWISGVLAVAAFLLCAYVGLNGLNHYAPSVAEGMRLDVRSEYSAAQLKDAAVYYRTGANKAAAEVDRDYQGNFDAAEFATLADQVGSGMHNLIRVSYVFGGSSIAPKELGYLSKYNIPSLYCCFTGECCVNPNVEDIALPFVMGREVSRRMSIARDDDAAFISAVSAMASDSVDYRYSGYFMAYRFCMEALESLDPEAAAEVAAGESDELKADLDACTFETEHSLGAQWLPKVEELDKKELETELNEAPDVASLLVSWQIRQTTPAEEPEQAPEEIPEDLPEEELPEEDEDQNEPVEVR